MSPRPLILVFYTLFFLPFLANSQEKYKLSGRVIDHHSEVAIPGASISVLNSTIGTISDSDGKWSFVLSRGSYTIIAKHVGYHPDTLLLKQDSRLSNFDFKLISDTLQISSVEVEGRARSWKLTKLNPGQIKLSGEELARIPSLLGSQDPLNNLRSLPGIQSVGEGTGYFYVRGGGADHNLIMLDNAVIYHPSHLIGLFSVLNPSVISSVSLYKGGIPANYGNRLASVIDIQSKDGDYLKWNGELSLGVIASRIGLNGPLIRDKLSVSLALRRTHLDLLYPLFMPKSHPFHGSGYAFTDLNANVVWKINNKNLIRLTTYSGRDKFKLEDSEISLSDEAVWGNNTVSIISENKVNQKLVLNSTVAFSGFDIQFGQDYRDYFVGLDSGLENFKFTQQISWTISSSNIVSSGVEINSYDFKPYRINAVLGDETLNFGDSIPYKARDAAVYLDHKWTIMEKFVLQTGVRLMHYQQRSPFRRFILNQGGFPVDSIYYGPGQTMAQYTRPEPRLSLSWIILENSRVKLAATRNYQTVHMVPLSTSTLPIDLWIPSTEIVKPQSSSSFSLGWFSDLPEYRTEISLEGYYRIMNNLVDFSEYQTIMGLVKNNIDQQMSFGKGTSYGLEFFIRKNSGKYSGWFAYTLSKTRYTFPDINEGLPFAPRHDRLHDFNIFISRELRKQRELSVQYTYASGQPATLPLSFYVLNGNVIQYYSDRNSIRLPAYHRLDFALEKRKATDKKYQTTWGFSIYNVYNRLNPFFIYYDLSWDYEKNLLLSKGRKIGLLPIIPSLSWTIRF